MVGCREKGTDVEATRVKILKFGAEGWRIELEASQTFLTSVCCGYPCFNALWKVKEHEE